MPRNHRPSKVSQAIVRGNGGKYSAPSSVPGNGYHCPKSPTGGHWWQIGSPDGAVSAGVCRHCGEKNLFANTMEVAFSGDLKE